ncbi:MAG: S-adenosylmethionine:tRNA ribosyltransferase-isomerase [Chitinophagales bacterium]
MIQINGQLHRKNGKIEHKVFKNVLDYFDDGDVMIVNSYQSFRLVCMVQKKKRVLKLLFLLRELNHELRLWDVLVDPARKIRVGNKLYFGDDDLVAEVVDNTTSRGRTIRFLFDGSDAEFRAVLDKLGNTPIPKYIKREREDSDKRTTKQFLPAKKVLWLLQQQVCISAKN